MARRPLAQRDTTFGEGATAGRWQDRKARPSDTLGSIRPATSKISVPPSSISTQFVFFFVSRCLLHNTSGFLVFWLFPLTTHVITTERPHLSPPLPLPKFPPIPEPCYVHLLAPTCIPSAFCRRLASCNSCPPQPDLHAFFQPAYLSLLTISASSTAAHNPPSAANLRPPGRGPPQWPC